jgi:glycosyltransferase involved in cell wall biosynthesis
MKIALISRLLPSGSKLGTGYQVHYLANELVKRGNDVVVYSMYPKPDGSLYDIQLLNVGSFFRTFRFMFSAMFEDFSNYDVIHSVGDATILFLRKGNAKVVRTYHGSALAEFINIRSFKDKVRMFALFLVEVFSHFFSDVNVAISNNTKKYLYFINKVISCGVDLSMFNPKDPKSTNPSILFVGELGRRKRGQMLVDIFTSNIKPRFENAELWLVTTEHVDRDGVKCFGRISTESLIELYQKTWVFCLPSTYEGFGVPYIEAMACGTPVVASTNLGAIEALDNGKYGILAADSEIGTTIIDFLESKKKREKYKALGLKRSEDFSFSKIADQYEMIYKDMYEK